jgi:aminocarboxymuconate-semialdehyde decarboxylase
MDSLGVDVHVLSTWVGLYNYDLPLEVGAATAKDCNDYVAELTKTWPQRFAGLATLPMQDVETTIGELKRAMTQLGLKGAMINDHINGHTLKHLLKGSDFG